MTHLSRSTLVRALARGALCGLLLGLVAVVAFAAMEAHRQPSVRWERVAGSGAFAALLGLLATAPTVALEARARRLERRPWSTSLACGTLMACTGVIVLFQLIYLVGAVHGGPEGGLRRVGFALSSASTDVFGALLGLVLALAFPFATAVALRLRGRRVVGQTLLGALVVGLGAGAVILTAFASTGGAFDPRVVHPLLVLPVAAATFGGFALLVVGLPLTLLTPLFLAASDRLGDRLAAAVELRWSGACRGPA